MRNIKFLYSDKNNFLKLLFPICIVLLCVMSLLLIKRIDNANRAAEWVNRTNLVRLALSETLSKLKDAEAEQRGYLLSKDSSFLSVLKRRSHDLNLHMGNLRLLMNSNPFLTAHVDSLEMAVNKRLHLLESVLVLYEDKQAFDRRFKNEILKGKAAMEAVEARLKLMDNLQVQLLRERTATRKRYVFTTPLHAAILTLSALLILTYAFYYLKRQLDLSKKYLNKSMAAEEKVRKVNSLLVNAEQLTRSGSWEYNTATQSLEHSENMFRLLGYESANFEPGEFDFRPLIDEADRIEMEKKMKELHKAGSVCEFYFWATRKDGQRRHFHCISHFSKNEQGEDMITGTTQDVTEKYLLKQEAEQRARFSELVVENNVDMIAAFDKELRVTVWNKAYEDKFGIQKKDILGKKLTDVFPYLEGDIKMVYLRAALRGQEVIRQEFPYFKNQRTGEISIIPIRDEAGKITGVVTSIHDVTEIKQVEKLLKESNQRFEHAEEAGHMGSFFLDLSTNEMNVSSNLYRLFGLEPHSIAPSLERFFTERVHPDHRTIVRDAYRNLINTGTFSHLVVKIIRVDGVVRHIKCSAIMSEHEDGKKVLFGNLLDITEETLLKQQLEERNQVVESLVENSDDLIQVIDTEMRITVWNKANEKQYGLSKKEVLGKKLTEVFPRIEENKRMEYIKAGLQGTPSYRKELQFMNGNKTGEFSYIPLHHADGSIMGLLVMAHDITERLKVAQKLKKANDELYYRNQALQEVYAFNRHISDLAPNGIYVYDRKSGSHVYTNKRTMELMGYSEHEMEDLGGELLSNLIHPDDLPELLEKFKLFDTAADDDILEFEYRMRNKEGHYHHMFTRETIFKRNQNGEPEQFIGVMMDVTELKEAEKELKEKNIALQQSNEELASFNYIASHDLQEPLRKIQTFGNFLEETETSLSESGRNGLQRMQMAAARMRTLINDLLSFSRISMVKEEMDQVDLNVVFEQARSSLSASINKREARIVGCELPTIQGVSFQLQQLFENIIGNAVKYCAPEVTPEVTLTARELSAGQAKALGLQPDWTYHCISFQDNGIGFEQQYAEKIFELFQRLHTKSEYPGTGLGLAICKKIVFNHGGHIQAISRPGEGSVFEIILPTARVGEMT